MVLWLVPIFMILYYVGFVNDVPGISSPLHASCKIKWNWPNNKCLEINQRMVDQIVKWTPEDICNGTQKCLYSLKEQNQNFIKATHTTPIKRYVDTLTFNFEDDDKGCLVNAFSSSDLWYAILDLGTNYCNLENLLTGASLDQLEGFVEDTSVRVCTQYTSANCTIY